MRRPSPTAGRAGSGSPCRASARAGPPPARRQPRASRSCHLLPRPARSRWQAEPLTFRPCHASGITGSGGAVVRFSTAAMSSDAPGAHSRERAEEIRVGVGRVEDRSRVHHRTHRAQRDSNPVTIPKLPRPPRRPHNRSAFSVSLAWMSRPSAVTTSAPTRLSHASPCLRISEPMPPPRVSPATPVEEMRPPVVARPCACVSWSTSAHTAPPPTVARRPPGRHARHSSPTDRSPPRGRRSRSRRCCGRRRGPRSPGGCCGQSAAEAITSAAPEQRITTAGGCRHRAPFQIFDASS